MPASSSDRDNFSQKQIFTTGEAAKVCNVSQQTIIRCFDNGRLEGFRVPGSRFRRIPRHELIRFMKQNGIPTGSLESGLPRVLLVDDDPEIVEVLRETLQREGRYEIRVAGTGYDAGMLTESFRPHVILLDYLLPDLNGDLVCRRLRENEIHAGTRIIIISGVVKQSEVEALLKAGADDFIRKPFDIRTVIERIDQLIESSSGVAR